jgi:hypothetical protein
MNHIHPNAGRVYALPLDEISDLESLAGVRQQQEFETALTAILETAATEIERLPPVPNGVWPVLGHDRASTIEMLRRDLMPDRTGETEVEPDVAAVNTTLFWQDFLKEKRL